MNKKGMEMWKLMGILLAIALLVFMLWWYSHLGESTEGGLNNLLGLFK
jgi:hypothetical protein